MVVLSAARGPAERERYAANEHYRDSPVICIYCQSEEGPTRDHVPPRQLLRKPYPTNLLTVPSCDECNRSYSRDEEYFRLVIVGLVCHTPEAEQLFDGPMSRSMDRIPGLEDLMFGSLAVNDEGVALDVDYSRIHRVADKIARGLRFAVLGLFSSSQTPYSIAFAEVDTPSSVQTFGPDFTYALHDSLGNTLEFTLYHSVRFQATQHNSRVDRSARSSVDMNL